MKARLFSTFVAVFIFLSACTSPAPEVQQAVEDTAPAVHASEEKPTSTFPLPTPTAAKSSLFIPLIGNAPTQTAIPTQPPTAAPAQPAAEGSSCIPNNEREQGMVTRVIDGDTIEVQIGDVKSRVRYIGMDTPEDTSQVEYFGPEATRYNQGLVGGKKVILVKDVSETDRYGRLLRYVIAEGVFVNYQLVRQGYASAATFPPDVACSDSFVNAECSARAEGLGLWKPAPAPTANAAPPPAGNCDASYPDFCIPLLRPT